MRRDASFSSKRPLDAYQRIKAKICRSLTAKDIGPFILILSKLVSVAENAGMAGAWPFSYYP